MQGNMLQGLVDAGWRRHARLTELPATIRSRGLTDKVDAHPLSCDGAGSRAVYIAGDSDEICCRRDRRGRCWEREGVGA